MTQSVKKEFIHSIFLIDHIICDIDGFIDFWDSNAQVFARPEWTCRETRSMNCSFELSCNDHF